MKKFLMTIFIMGACLVTLTGCTTSKSYTWSIENGDKVKIELNTTDGYDITSESPFEITKDDKTVMAGFFVTEEQYEQYLLAVDTDPLAEVIKKDSKDGNKYTFYSYNDSEYNYIIKVSGSNTGVILSSPSKVNAEKCFELLTITQE